MFCVRRGSSFSLLPVGVSSLSTIEHSSHRVPRRLCHIHFASLVSACSFVTPASPDCTASSWALYLWWNMSPHHPALHFVTVLHSYLGGPGVLLFTRILGSACLDPHKKVCWDFNWICMTVIDHFGGNWNLYGILFIHQNNLLIPSFFHVF